MKRANTKKLHQRKGSMKKDLQIICRNIPQSTSLNNTIQQKVDKLEQFYSDITSCRVVLEAPHKSQHKGLQFRTTVEVTFPDTDMVVNHSEHADLYAATRNAFATTHRQLATSLNKRRSFQRHAC